jgi:hypothetical protein
MTRFLLAALVAALMTPAQAGRPVGQLHAVRGWWTLDGVPVPRDTVTVLLAGARLRRDPSRPKTPRDFVDGYLAGGRAFRVDCATSAPCDTGVVITPPSAGSLLQLKAFKDLHAAVGSSRFKRYLAVLGSLSSETTLRDGIVALRAGSADLAPLVSGADDALTLTVCPASATDVSCTPDDPAVRRCTAARAGCRVSAMTPGLYELRLFRSERRGDAVQWNASGRMPALVLALSESDATAASADLRALEREFDAWQPVPQGPSRVALVRALLLARAP